MKIYFIYSIFLEKRCYSDCSLGKYRKKKLPIGFPCCRSTVSIELGGRQAEVWVTRRINTVSGFPPRTVYTLFYDATLSYIRTVCM